MATCFKVKKNNKGCKFMEVSDKMMGLVCAAFMSMIISVTDTPADEIGLAIGLNSSMYKPWDKNNAEYQKTDILNPIEITFQKKFNQIFGYPFVSSIFKKIYFTINAGNRFKL